MISSQKRISLQKWAEDALGLAKRNPEVPRTDFFVSYPAD
jgi:hypothetical protein